MSSAPTIHKNDSRGSERRSCPREPLKWVVLVFFGEDNWGKLIDMSESGMSIEFAHLPPLHQRINFTFEAMGCMPLPAGGKIFSGSFKKAGNKFGAGFPPTPQSVPSHGPTTPNWKSKRRN